MTGREITERLDEHERTQSWLGRKLGVSRTTVWRWVNEHEPVPEKREREIVGLLPDPEREPA